jgi:hypothetical protein
MALREVRCLRCGFRAFVGPADSLLGWTLPEDNKPVPQQTLCPLCTNETAGRKRREDSGSKRLVAK